MGLMGRARRVARFIDAAVFIGLALSALEVAAQQCIQHGYLPNEPALRDMGVQCQTYTTTSILFGGPTGWSFQQPPCGFSEVEADMRQCLTTLMSGFRSCYRRTETTSDWILGTWGDAGFTPEGALNLRRDHLPFRTYFAHTIFVNGVPSCGTEETYLEWAMYRERRAYCPLGKPFYGWDYSDPGGPMFCADFTPVVKGCSGTDQLPFGNPVDIASGAKLHQEFHLRGGPFAVPLTWFYRSNRQHFVSELRSIEPGSTRGILAYKDRVWKHSFDKQLLVDRTGFRPAVRITQPGAARDAFFALTASGWTPSQFGNDTLREVTGGSISWIYRSSDNVAEGYGADGRLMFIAWPSGKQITLIYAGDLLTEARNSFGVPVRFNYVAGQLSNVVDSASRLWTYTFAPIAKTLLQTSFPDSASRRFLYEAPYAHLLTGVIDERGNRVGTYSYNNVSQRAIATERTPGVDRFSFTYRDPYVGPSHPIVSTPLGGTAQTYWAPLGPHLRDGWYLPVAEVFTGVSSRQPGCENLHKSSQTDSYGNWTEKIDFADNKTCFAYDVSRNLEIKRVEGLGATSVCSTAWTSPPTGSRIISTQWHPDWRLETRIAEPKKLTTIVYNGQGATCAPSTVLVDGKPPAVICTRTEQATTDESGAAGFSDPNGVVTVLTYDPRMRLTSRTVGNEATVFGYDPVGQMTSVNLPDGARLTYTYDAAHRLTAINDHKGNRIDYTLDAIGNRTAEQMKDPGGVLVGNIARVIDALNRVQQVTGAGR